MILSVCFSQQQNNQKINKLRCKLHKYLWSKSTQEILHNIRDMKIWEIPIFLPFSLYPNIFSFSWFCFRIEHIKKREEIDDDVVFIYSIIHCVVITFMCSNYFGNSCVNISGMWQIYERKKRQNNIDLSFVYGLFQSIFPLFQNIFMLSYTIIWCSLIQSKSLTSV